jgi:undecaprenyl-diphosphatase
MNNQIFFFFYNFAHQSKILDAVIVFFAVYFPYIVAILALLFFLFYYKVLPSKNPVREFAYKWKKFIPACISLGVAFALDEILKIIFHTSRPFVALPQVHSLFPEIGYAFPSWHTMFFSALAFFIFSLHKKAGYVFVFFVVLIGIARIAAGVHFPIDILGGFILGGLVSYFVAFFAKNV